MDNGKLSGVVGFFDDPHALIEATRKVRDARYQYFDAFTPFPVHGLEAAQGLKRSALPYVTFGAGLTGLSLGFLLQYWTSAVSWPINVGGKPLNSWPAFVPIMFEITVLLAALSTVGAMFLINGLPNLKRRAIDPALTRDRFAIVIENPPVSASDHLIDDDGEQNPAALRAAQAAAKFKGFQEAEAKAFLSQLGAREVRSYFTEGWF